MFGISKVHDRIDKLNDKVRELDTRYFQIPSHSILAKREREIDEWTRTGYVKKTHEAVPVERAVEFILDHLGIELAYKEGTPATTVIEKKKKSDPKVP